MRLVEIRPSIWTRGSFGIAESGLERCIGWNVPVWVQKGTNAMDVRTDKRTLETMQTRNPHSTAQIAGHPIHPMLIPFPIAFFVATFVADIVFMRTMDTGWALATQWLLGAGLVMAALAAIVGLTDFLGERRIRNLNAAWWHAGANVLAVLISLYNFYVRYEAGAAAGITTTQIVLSGIVVLLLLFSGWLGGEMVYRHRVGIQD